MTLLPVAERELRVGARRKSAYRLRFFVALGALGLSFLVYLISALDKAPPEKISQALFVSVASLVFVYTLLAGIFVTADSLSEERREGTLGLLFLTDLKGYDVVLGKLAAKAMNAVYGLLAVFPVLAIPLLMGGLSPQLVWHVTLVLLNTLFFSLAAGLLASSWSCHERKAMAVAFLWILLFTALIPALGAFLLELVFNVNRKSFEEWIIAFLGPSPVFSLVSAFAADNAMAPPKIRIVWFWGSLGIIHGLGWGFLWLTCRNVPRVWQDRETREQPDSWRMCFRSWVNGTATERAAWRQQWLETNPFLWLGLRNRMQLSLLWLGIGLVGLGYFVGLLKWQDDWLTAPVCIMTVLVLHGLIKLWIAGQASTRFLDDRREGILELVLSTPIPVHYIVRGHWLALFRQYRQPLGLILLIDGLLLVTGLKDIHNNNEQRDLIIVFLAGMLMLALDALALFWTGLWNGLAKKNAARAIGSTLFWILVLPWGLFGLTVVLYLACLSFASLGGSVREPELYELVLWWIALGLAIDLAAAKRAHTRLSRDFRQTTLQRYFPARRAFWARWF